MGNITLNNSSLKKYISFLERFDNCSKEKLISKLSESIERDSEPRDIDSFFGAWEDSRSSDEIISDLRV